ncbi:MAG: hypothetical protein RL737_610 [Bacteroidota bacterium]|jgi:hypothetical protein
MKRIWNEQELKAMPDWEYSETGFWWKIGCSTTLLNELLGREIDDFILRNYTIKDWMIATTEDKPQTQNNMKTSVTLNNEQLDKIATK